jgi:hypothetical protein
MYLWRTPLGTYGYNTASVRVKLKKGVHFAYLHQNQRKCPIDPKQDSNTVYVSYLGSLGLRGWSEYILCSGGPVESWSTATPEGLKEMAAEEKWIHSHHNGDFDTPLHIAPGAADNCATCPLFHYSVPDAHTDWSANRLSKDFDNIKKELEKDKDGEIFYAPGVPQDRRRHFSTHLPSYFNPVSETK